VAAAGTSADIVAVAADAESLLDLLAAHGSRLVLSDVAVAAASYGAAVRAAAVNLSGNCRVAEGEGAAVGDLIPLAEADALVARMDVLAALSRIPG
jgi:formiminotetrahydrofolate cyclodeaminase